MNFPLFHNLTVHKDKFSDEIYLNTAQSGTAVNTTDDFQEIHVLSTAPQVPAEYLATAQGSKLMLTNSQNGSDSLKEFASGLTSLVFEKIVPAKLCK